MDKIRLLKLKKDSGPMQMAVDEAITLRCSLPTLRFYTFDPPAITLGQNQEVKKFNLKPVEKKGFDLVRRITGGTAVLHKNDLVYSLVMAENFLPEKVVDAYRFLSEGLVEGLKNFGLKAEKKVAQAKKRQPSCYLNENPYDIVVNGKKISGNAQARIKGIVLQHGTIIIENNLGELFDCLIADTCHKNDFLEQAGEKVTSLEEEMPNKPTVEEVAKAMTYGFKKLFSTKDLVLQPGELTQKEKNLAEKLYRQKYSTNDWNHQI